MLFRLPFGDFGPCHGVTTQRFNVPKSGLAVEGLDQAGDHGYWDNNALNMPQCTVPRLGDAVSMVAVDQPPEICGVSGRKYLSFLPISALEISDSRSSLSNLCFNSSPSERFPEIACLSSLEARLLIYCSTSTWSYLPFLVQSYFSLRQYTIVYH